jgi:hypothetical protein
VLGLPLVYALALQSDSVRSSDVGMVDMVRNQISDDEMIATYIDPNPSGLGRSDARLKRYGNHVWLLVSRFRHGDLTVEQLAAEYAIPVEAAEAALAFYRCNKDAIDARILLNDAAFDE